MSILTGLPAWLMTLVWFLIAVVAVILVAMVVHALGGFSWDLHLGHFHLLIAVT